MSEALGSDDLLTDIRHALERRPAMDNASAATRFGALLYRVLPRLDQLRISHTLNEGYCEICRTENQRALNSHNAQFDQWQSMSDAQRDRAIGSACR